MSAPAFSGRRWPGETQLLLLKAALAEGDGAVAALREWERRVDIERLSNASYSLLPLLYHRLQASGTEARDKARMRGLYRRTWYQNQAALGRARAAVTALAEAGIGAMVLKGTSLIALGLVDAGARPMVDCDIMVQTSRAQDAYEVLRALGYRASLRLPADLRKVTSVLHSTELVEGAGHPLDLHWHLVLTSCAPDSDDAFWNGARGVDVLGAPAQALNPADLLLHVCSHGSLWTPIPSFRWIADTVTVLRKDGEMDWDRLCRQAREHRLTLEVGRALGFVGAHFDVACPPEILRELERAPVGTVSRVHYALQGSPMPVIGPLGRDLARYAILSRGRPARRRLADTLLFFRVAWNIAGVRELPAWLLSKARARLRGSRMRRGGLLREHDYGG